MKKIAAIYARRSKQVETGDSVKNQIDICSNYLKNLGIDDYIIYSDEGFSGKNIERPAFIRMMNDAKEKKFQILTCYKLDRVSRSVCDFSDMINSLEKYNISFISVVEQFDTSTPMGKAMMYICSVFSQLERETIAGRVKDNMYKLAEDGYWLGGKCPLGFNFKRQEFMDNDGKKREICVLTPKNDEVNLVELIFNKYVELKSLSKLQKYLLKNNIKTPNDKYWSKTTLSGIIENPVYVKADTSVIQYFSQKDITINGTIDGVHGILTYKKRNGKSGHYRNSSEWIYAVSNHEGLISSDLWLKAQLLYEENTKKAPKLGKSNNAALSGLVRCAKCGSPMKVVYGTPNSKTQIRKHYYKCTLKSDSGNAICNNKNVDGPELDNIIINKLKDFSIDKSSFLYELKKYKQTLDNPNNYCEKNEIIKEIDADKKKIDNLINTLSIIYDESVKKDIINKISLLNKDIERLTSSLDVIDEQLSSQKSIIDTYDNIISKIHDIPSYIDSADISEKKSIISSIIDKIFVDGDTGSVKIQFKLD